MASDRLAQDRVLAGDDPAEDCMLAQDSQKNDRTLCIRHRVVCELGRASRPIADVMRGGRLIRGQIPSVRPLSRRRLKDEFVD